jgi:hypothetical protein
VADEEYESNFDVLLGTFGGHANIEKRRKAERLAAMEPDDGRRKKLGRNRQFNTRITEESFALAQRLIERLTERDGRKWSQADLLEAAFAALARAEKLEGNG